MNLDFAFGVLLGAATVALCTAAFTRRRGGRVGNLILHRGGEHEGMTGHSVGCTPTRCHPYCPMPKITIGWPRRK